MAQDRPIIPITPNVTEIPYVLLPETESLFSDRALRLGNLAHGHAMADYLRFAAAISQAQQGELNALPTLILPNVAAGQPPLSTSLVTIDPVWQQVFHRLVDAVSAQAPQDYAARLKNLMTTASKGDLERWAQAHLHGDRADGDIGLLPILAAALQVVWAAMTRSLPPRLIPARGDHASHTCPGCDSLPVGSIVRSGAANQGLRYLTCSLCASQWNLERIRCIHCGDAQHVFYYGIEGTDGAIQAETCDSCHTYSKIMHTEKNPAVDMMADDLATMSLDILVGEAGYQRYGFNPLLITEPEPATV